MTTIYFWSSEFNILTPEILHHCWSTTPSLLRLDETRNLLLLGPRFNFVCSDPYWDLRISVAFFLIAKVLVRQRVGLLQPYLGLGSEATAIIWGVFKKHCWFMISSGMVLPNVFRIIILQSQPVWLNGRGLWTLLIWVSATMDGMYMYTIICMYIYIYTHVHVYVYIYIYTHAEPHTPLELGNILISQQGREHPTLRDPDVFKCRFSWCRWCWYYVCGCVYSRYTKQIPFWSHCRKVLA